MPKQIIEEEILEGGESEEEKKEEVKIIKLANKLTRGTPKNLCCDHTTYQKERPVTQIEPFRAVDESKDVEGLKVN
jgi:hypothetical protein